MMASQGAVKTKFYWDEYELQVHIKNRYCYECYRNFTSLSTFASHVHDDNDEDEDDANMSDIDSDCTAASLQDIELERRVGGEQSRKEEIEIDTSSYSSEDNSSSNSSASICKEGGSEPNPNPDTPKVKVQRKKRVRRRAGGGEGGRTRKIFVCQVEGCSLKDQPFQRGLDLRRHTSKFHMTPEERAALKSHLCADCGRRFDTVSHLKDHIRKNHREGPGEFACDSCDRSYHMQWLLTKHKNLKHLPKDELERRKREQEQRELVKNGGRLPYSFECTICSKSFKTDKIRRIHNQRFHNPKMAARFKCPEPSCERSARGFNTNQCLQDHVNRIHRQKKLPCPHCQKFFSDQPAMVKHINLVHMNVGQSLCHLCAKSFCSPNNLKKHLLMIHDVGDPDRLCPYCGSKFYQESDLQRHIMKHTLEKPFKCTYENCTEGFTQSHSLKRHLWKHEGLKPYKCKQPGCQAAYDHSGLLKRHISKQHVNNNNNNSIGDVDLPQNDNQYCEQLV